MDAYPALTRSQELILLGQQLAPASPLNNMGFAFTLRFAVDVPRLQAAFAKLVQACDAMRVTVRDGKWAPLDSVTSDLPFFDATPEGTADFVQQKIEDSLQKAFQPGGRLFDAALFKQGEEQYLLYLNQHHLITDGWGYAAQVAYLLAVYAGESTEPLPSYLNYVSKMAVEKLSEETRKFTREWQQRVADYPAPPALFGRVNSKRSSRSVRITRQLTGPEAERLLAVTAETDVRSWTKDLALFNVLLTSVFTYVFRISGQYDLAIGAPAHNRLSSTDKQTAGLFMELFPIRTTMAAADTLGDVLQKVKASTMDFLRNARPGTSSADTGRSFNVLFNFINQALHPGKLDIATEWLHSGDTEQGHHLKIQVYDFDATGRWTFCFDLNTEVIPAELHEQVVDGYFATLWQVVNNRSLPLTGVDASTESFLEVAEKSPQEDYPQGVTVLDLIERQVHRTPDQVAVRTHGEALTFATLNHYADELAGQLRRVGVGRGDIVPLCLDRSFAMVVGLVGIMKAGAGYLPIDPALPDERIRYLVDDATAKVYVTTEQETSRLADLLTVPGHVLSLGGQLIHPTTPAVVPSPEPLRPRPEDIMYVLYTSGSTGRPKGVVNQHDGLVNRLEWARRTFTPAGQGMVVLQKTTFTFDVSVWEIFLPLISGAELFLAKPGGEKDAQYIRDVIRDYKINILHFVPPMLELFLLQRADLPSLQHVVCSGEALLPQQANTFTAYYPQARLHNLYGPTEAAIDVTHWEVPGTEVERVPIGRTIANVWLRVYGPQGERFPIGVPGELYLSGVQVARGYLNRPELTAEKFIHRDGRRWYRTGDLVRWLPDGTLEFLGRIDHQVKLRGFRIELGEIEVALRELEGVGQAVVLLKKDGKGEPALVAYVVGEANDTASLKAELTSRLPAYMVPSAFLFLEQMPLLPNGKIDRKKLPEPAFDLSGAAKGEELEGEFEEIIHEAWREVFAIEKIGREVHFLDLGGHSLTGIRLISRVNDAFDLELPADTIFRYSTIARLAEHVEATIRELLSQMED